MKKIICFLLLAVFQFGGAALAQQTAATPVVAELPAPPIDKAQIVFIKPMSGIWGDLPLQISEIRNNSREFFGVMGSDSKLIVNVDPGKHMFMSTMYKFSHFLDADVVAGKRYYVLVRFIYANGSQLRPIKLNGPSDYSPQNPKFSEWKSSTHVIVKTPGMDRYALKQAKRAGSSQEKAWKIWLEKTPEQRAELSIKPDDFLD